MYIVKTTVLICTFVFAYRYAKSRFSHDAAHICSSNFDRNPFWSTYRNMNVVIPTIIAG